jgi:hypothetical protein
VQKGLYSMVLMDGNDNAAAPKVLPRATSKVVKKAKMVASSKSKLDPRVAGEHGVSGPASPYVSNEISVLQTSCAGSSTTR